MLKIPRGLVNHGFFTKVLRGEVKLRTRAIPRQAF
jgi:hypothetical protein